MLKITRFDMVAKYVKKMKSIIIFGPRGVGKSFFLKKQLLPTLKIPHLYIDLLRSAEYGKFLKHPQQFAEEVESKLKISKKLLVIVDEIQRLPGLLNDIQSLIEDHKDKLHFILTGSSARKLKRGDANLLAGRAYKISFTNLSFLEISFRDNLYNILQYGLLPQVYTETEIEFKEEFLTNYCHTYLKEEIQQEALVRNLESFSKFLELAAQSNGAPINCSKIANQIKVAPKTVNEYYKILEDTLLAHKVLGWSESVRKQLQTAPKYYFFDNGVINALKGELRTELRPSSYRYGILFENMIINEIIKLINSKQLSWEIYYYRTNNGGEIDLILKKKEKEKNKIIAIEFKSNDGSELTNERDFRTLLDFKKEFPKASLQVWCLAKRPFKRFTIDFIPYMEALETSLL
ncbi:MAG: ATP-binding protein [Oligoflexia bacterium]|nr:ATP-binding protein [Oligoflexia bacterium]